MAKLKSGTRIYGSSTIDTSLTVGTSLTLGTTLTMGTGVVLTSPASNVFTISTNNTEHLRVTNTGKVGVNTPNPTEQFEVNGVVKATSFSGSIPVTIDITAADILNYTANSISAIDATTDKLIFWDDSANKITYLTIGSGLSISGTTITATGGGGGGSFDTGKAVAISMIF